MHIVNRNCSLIGMHSYAFPSEMQDSDIIELIHSLELELLEAVSDGQIIFQSGMSMGADIWAAKSVLKLKDELPQIQLHCYLPNENQANNWPEQWREQYFDILAEADEVFCMQNRYSKGCFYRRNWEMLTRSARVIMLYGKKADGGIKQAIDYCQAHDVKTRIIRQTDEGLLIQKSGEPIIQITDYINSQTSSVYFAGLDMGRSAIKSAW